MEFIKKLEVWFVVGSQHLYGNETLRQAEANARAVVAALNAEARFPVSLVLKPLVTGLKARGFCFATLRDHPVYRPALAGR